MNRIKTLYFDCISSTNDIVRDYDRPWTVAIAEEQSLGRGQRGNSWESQKGANLTFSLLIKPSFLHIEKQFYISMITSLAVTDALASIGLSAKIKWPNDIYIEDRKICGILIENDISGRGSISRSIIGVGLNVNQTEFLSDAPNPTSCALETGREHQRKGLLNSFYNSMVEYFSMLEDGKMAEIETSYKALLYSLGIEAKFSDSDGEFLGTILDVEQSGVIHIKHSDGDTKGYLFKEVNFII